MMDNSEHLPPAYPFAAAEMDIDMIDKSHTASNGAVAPGPAGQSNPIDLARQLTDVVQDLVRRLNEQQAFRQQLEQKLSTHAENARAYDSLKQTLRDVASTEVSEEELQTLQRVLQALAQDPNHIMVLASVAQQATKLQTVVASFAKLHAALTQAPPR